MTRILVRKLLRDVALSLFAVCLLSFAFQCLWAKVTDRITNEILAQIRGYMPIAALSSVLFQGSGKILQALIGGETINLERALDMMSIGYVHPLTQIILCVWAVGRSSGAIAGEIDRGTMELLLAQPLRRRSVVLAHLWVDVLTIPALCLSMWAGTWLGAWLVGFIDNPSPEVHVDPRVFAASLLNVALLVFAVSGYTLFLSAVGRFRWRVMGVAVLLTLLQFLINVIGQLWDAAGPLRSWTVFYYYQPQPMILHADWYEQAEVWRRLGMLFVVGTVGYVLALWTFCRRDLPAPL